MECEHILEVVGDVIKDFFVPLYSKKERKKEKLPGINKLTLQISNLFARCLSQFFDSVSF